MNRATLRGLSTELLKISAAQQEAPKKDGLKKFLKSTAAIVGGTGLGYGAASVADMAFHKALGTKWEALGSSSKKRLLGAALGLASSGVLVGREWVNHERREASK